MALGNDSLPFRSAVLRAEPFEVRARSGLRGHPGRALPIARRYFEQHDDCTELRREFGRYWEGGFGPRVAVDRDEDVRKHVRAPWRVQVEAQAPGSLETGPPPGLFPSPV